MLVTGIQRISSNCKMARTLATSVIRGHNNRNSNAPLLEKYRPVWPDSDFGKGNVEELPLRSVPQEDLKFQLTASFENGSSLFYPHLPHNPADFKVKLSVSIDKLGLSKDEQEILIRMVGSRYNVGKREIKLTADRFPNRIENKRYLSVILEKLVAEAKTLYVQKSKISNQ